jgi:hypothetical protein
MTVGQLKKILKNIPNDFDVAMGIDNSLIPICPIDSEAIQIVFNDSKEKVWVFVLAQCSTIPHEDESHLN